ncbi:uncharacterized protein EI97DRAFT_432024 [Westerdykella ornata]|uniref:Ubiquinol-cytochrome c chaperone domain-containing protein n=1 Tax=Westerdykella ornata TaxID=318751 RepID=A0A6A6JN53_WESOR|nr:uncharacterized protein EI97DRAFT_432024 [Westerdykella ornata]KAF2277932.1 hypothetical protein EI97DRAFT_432024 [Westerdykella ornata]
MASNYACRACSRALSRPPKLISQPSQLSRATSTHITAPLINKRTYSTAPPSPNPSPPPPPRWRAPGARKIAETLRKKAPIFTETYVAYGATGELFKKCAAPGAYTIPQATEKGAEIPTDEDGTHVGVGSGWWYDTLGLKPTFNNWAQITFLHMYMLQVRFRMFPSTHAPIWIQHLTNHAFAAAEDRLFVYHKFTQSSLRQRYLKNVFASWRAVLMAYDEGLVKGDAVLAAAVWRNLFGAREDVDAEKLAMIVGYMRREIRRLETTGDDDVAGGNWEFGPDPGAEAELVRREDRGMTAKEGPQQVQSGEAKA